MPAEFRYLTPSAAGESLYREKGSRFIGLATHVGNEAEVKQFIAGLWDNYPDATHICYAYLLKKDKGEGRANDDGEPAGTAGRPILNQILSSGCEDILVSVVRYYGGTKLGTGGLIQAYKTAAKEAILAAEITEIEIQEPLSISFPFALEGRVNSILKKYRIQVKAKNYSAECRLALSVPVSVWDETKAELESTHGLVLNPD